MEKKLSNKEILKLIALYRSNALLWDMNSKMYRRNDLKIKAYENIATEMNLPADIVKKKIRALRSTYTGEKKKMFKKSGSATDEVYESSLFWFSEMSFLDSSIAIRSSLDNTKENITESQSFDYLEEHIEEYTSSEPHPECTISEPTSSNKKNKHQKTDDSSKFDEAIEKLLEINNKENEYTAFASSVAFQLQQFSEEEAYSLMGEIQNLLAQRKSNLKKIMDPLSSGENNWYPDSSENSTECTSTPLKTLKKRRSKPFSDILSCAISDADIEFTND